MRRAPIPVEPEVSPGLLAWLEFTFPIKVARVGMTVEELFIGGGQQDVLAHLRSLLEGQTAL